MAFVRQQIGSLMRGGDGWLASASLRLLGERPGVMSLLFHGMFANQRELAAAPLDPAPQQAMTVSVLRRLVEHFLTHEYRITSPAVLDGLGPGGHYLILTFDDGYANNHNVLQVLDEFGIPAVFYISANHVRFGQAFWWDVLYRERARRGLALHLMEREKAMLKRWTHDRIAQYLDAEFGEAALRPVGDLDRAFTPAELRQFASHPGVVLGNHTADHAILTNYPDAGIAAQISDGRDAIESMTGRRPDSISYPNGNYDARVVAAARAAGMHSGITLDPHKDRLPVAGERDGHLRLGRFVLRGGPHLERDCNTLRSSYSLIRTLRALGGRSY